MTDSRKHIVGKSDSIGITDAEVAKIAGVFAALNRWTYRDELRATIAIHLKRNHIQQETPDA